MRKLLVWCVTLGFLLNGCSILGRGVASTPLDISGVESSPLPPVETKPILPTVPATIVPSDTPMPSVTPFTPFVASVWADNVNVRTNPGYLFPSLKLLAKGSKFTVMGKAPGGEWVQVQLPDGKTGWVFSQLIESSVNFQEIPTIEPVDVQLIKGLVKDSAGVPIKGIGFTILQEAGGKSSSNTVLTDSNGEFYSFMPLSAKGDWTVSFNAIACKSNVWTDDSCTYYKQPYRGVVEPQSVVITLPHTAVLELVWK